MASVSVLYIDDPIVGPHLELLRNICEPNSNSRPHVTVRYFGRLSIPDEYQTTAIGDIDITEPGSFGLDDDSSTANRTVFLRCKSDDLVPLEHKPHYPTSDFHITIYDGRSKVFAKRLLNTLRKFKWGFRVRLPGKTTLTTISIKPRGPRPSQGFRDYNQTLQHLFSTATTKALNWQHLINLSDTEKLKLVRDVCKSLHRAAGKLKRIDVRHEGTPPKTQKLHAGHKEALEVHLTPPELADEIAEYAVGFLEPKDMRVHFGDPAVGTGAFYSAVRKTLKSNQIASAIGIDISEPQVAAAQMRWGHKGMEVLHGDYLHMERLSPRTLILANPPYLRHQGIPHQYKHELRDRASVIMGKRVSARSGLYVYFMLLSHTWMKTDAVAAWLIPSEFMQTCYGAALRHYLTQNVRLIRIHQFAHDDPKFENVFVLPAVVVFRNLPPSKGQTILMSVGGTISAPRHIEQTSIDELRHATKWSIPTRLARTHHSSDICIRDIFTVRRGIATGANEFFVLTREEAHRHGIPEAYLRPVLPKARTLEKDVIDRAPDGYPLVTPQLCLLHCDLPADDIKVRYPSLMKYLKTAEPDIRNRYLVRRRHPWYKQEWREPATFLCTYMGRHRANGSPIRFLWNKSDAIATNTYLMLYPRKGLFKLLHEQPSTAEKVFELLQETVHESMKASWRVHAGGLHKIEPGDLLNVRLAASPKWLADVIDPKLSTD